MHARHSHVSGIVLGAHDRPLAIVAAVGHRPIATAMCRTGIFALLPHPLRVRKDRRTTLIIPGVATEMTAWQR
jgi:hypothetical protein